MVNVNCHFDGSEANQKGGVTGFAQHPPFLKEPISKFTVYLQRALANRTEAVYL